MSAWTISDLREERGFAEVVADRIWRAWWAPSGHAIEDVRAALEACLDAAAMPFTLVAHRDGTFLGTATGIASDLAERPALGPWVAALWVEPAHRRAGIGAALVGQVAERLERPVYICARRDLRGFYARCGWAMIESGVGPDGLDIFRLA